MLVAGISASREPAITGYAAEVLADSPIAYWRLDEPSGTTAADAVGSNDGTYVGGVVLNQTSLITSGASINPSGAITPSGMRLLSPPAELQITGDITMEVWVHFTSRNSAEYVMSCTSNGETEADNYIWNIRIEAAGAITSFHEYGTGNNEIITSTCIIPLNETHHIVVVRDTTAKTYTFYDDGVLCDTVGYTNNPTGGTNADIHIGHQPESDLGTVSGRIDEVAVYNTKLSGTRILAHYNAGIL